MNPNQWLADFESMLARLDAALNVADAEAACAKLAETRVEELLNRLERDERRDAEIAVGSSKVQSSHRNWAANDNHEISAVDSYPRPNWREPRSRVSA